MPILNVLLIFVVDAAFNIASVNLILCNIYYYNSLHIHDILLINKIKHSVISNHSEGSNLLRLSLFYNTI